MFRPTHALLALAAPLLAAGPACAGQFDFTPAPQTDLNRIYRLGQSCKIRRKNRRSNFNGSCVLSV